MANLKAGGFKRKTLDVRQTRIPPNANPDCIHPSVHLQLVYVRLAHLLGSVFPACQET